MGDPARPPLMVTLRRGEGAPLFLVPSVGLTPMSLMRLARAVEPSRPVHAFGYAGAEGERPPHATLDAMAHECADEMLALGARGPWRLGGHCLGGTVALAIALELESRGERVARLALVDVIAPLLDDDRPDFDAMTTGDIDALEPALRGTLASIADRTFASAQALGPELYETLQRTVDAYMEAAVAYRARRCSAPIHLLETEAGGEAPHDRWSRIGGAGVTRHALPGDTFSILRPPHADAVGRILGRAVDGP